MLSNWERQLINSDNIQALTGLSGHFNYHSLVSESAGLGEGVCVMTLNRLGAVWGSWASGCPVEDA